MPADAPQRIHAPLAAKRDGRIRRDIPEEARHGEPRNFIVHVIGLARTKCADGIADPKLTLIWLTTSLGATDSFVALLVPVREAGVLLPKLIIAGSFAILESIAGSPAVLYAFAGMAGGAVPFAAGLAEVQRSGDDAPPAS